MAVDADDIDKEFRAHQFGCVVCSKPGAELCWVGLNILLQWADAVLKKLDKKDEAA